MKNQTANNIGIAIFLMSAFVSSSIIGGVFWNIISVAFLISGAYGIVCSFKGVKFLY
ncbi:hypothetical protein J4233_00260 [Candidatus Pacearchaeota archaeon]|nr:hypothetical protein [Candidatus Pacearchaeota archaeon]